MELELELGLALPSNPDLDLNAYASEPSKRKRCLDDHHNGPLPPTLPLLFWNSQPNEDQDPPRRLDDDASAANENDEELVVGWPPIKSWRRKVMSLHAAGNCRRAGPNSKYVKVKMEGVGIARKIDLSLYHSYHTLMDTLTNQMFHIYCGKVSTDDYKLVYQDNEGDWLLAADVPWRTFIRNVQRLKLARTSNGV